jgi:hypothetical protein
MARPLVDFLVISSKMVASLRFAVLAIAVATGLATDYYISTSGADANNGQSSSSAWLSLNNSYLRNFEAGDRLLLQRGDVWSDEPLLLSMVTGMSIDAYGNATLARPRLVMGRNANNQRAFCVHAMNCNGLSVQNLHLAGCVVVTSCCLQLPSLPFA